MSNNVKKLIDVFLAAFTPPLKMTVADWATKYREVESGNSKVGKYNPDLVPYQIEPMEAFTADHVRETILMWGTQLGKTFLLQNLIGYMVDVEPSKIMVKYPTQIGADTFSRDKLTPMFEDTPRLAGIFKDNKTKDSDNTISYKKFKGGSIFFVGSNSPSAIRSKSCRVIIQDEISGDTQSAGDEGNPQRLADNRADSFDNPVFVKASTPLDEGSCAITAKMEESDFRKWFAVRGENYTPQSLPIEVQKITGGADVQKDRIELFVAGWGESEECWAIEYKVFHGDTNKPGVWDEFREYLLNASYKKTDGNNLVFSTVLIDSGNGTQQNAILDFSAPLRRYGIYGCKGIERAGIHPPELVKLSTNNARKIHQYMVGTRIAKTIIYDRLTLKEKGAGFIHFPKDQGFDDRYYKQLTSERKIQKYAHGRAYHTFIAYKGQRNEALDVFVYALTANRIKNRTVPYVNPNESKATGPITETPAVIVQPVRKKYIPIDQRIAA